MTGEGQIAFYMLKPIEIICLIPYFDILISF